MVDWEDENECLKEVKYDSFDLQYVKKQTQELNS